MVFVINKLYRDDLVNQQTAMGWKILCTRKIGQELIHLLYEKGEEEIRELEQLSKELQQQTTRKLDELQRSLIKEMKDIQEVIDVLEQMGEKSEKLIAFKSVISQVSSDYQIDGAALADAQQKDRDERGSFKEWRYVFKQEIPQDTQENKTWHNYFAKKYPQEDTF